MNRGIVAALILAIASAFPIASATAGPCSEDVASFRQALNQQRRQPDGFGTAPQSIAAQLERQPTPESVERAKKSAQASISDLLTRAETLDAQGKADECRNAIATARLMLNP
jgi:hypothetical protein